MTKQTRRGMLDDLYARYNRRERDLPDPVDFLWHYEDVRDREVAGLVASTLAYGRVAQIMKSVSFVLERMRPPAHFLRRSSRQSLEETFKGFRHRFASGREMASLLNGVRHAIQRHGSLESCFRSFLDARDDTLAPALGPFVSELRAGMDSDCGHLLPTPESGSACKRLTLYLRWMARCDMVDPGGWDEAPASKLVVPLDTHMKRIGRAMGLTQRKSADMRAAIDITTAFRAFAPDDPVRYDFALTRLAMKKDGSLSAFLDEWRRTEDT